MDSIEEMTKVRTPSKLYDESLQWLRSQGFHLTLNPSAKSTCFHDMYRVKRPIRVPGIRYPGKFNVFSPINSEDLMELQELYIFSLTSGEIDQVVAAFMKPLLFPEGEKSSDVRNHSLQLTRIENALSTNRSDSKHHLGISFQPSTLKGSAPRAFLPERSWFDSDLEEVTLYDIFTIFPKTEVDVLALLLGRAVVGRTGHIPVDWDEPIQHTSRIMGVVYGHDPGTGKSYTFGAINSALRRCGYKVTEFNKLNSQFNMDEIIKAEFSYCDDATMEGLEKMLKGDLTKSIITNAGLRVENKGVDAYNTYSHTTLLANVNRWNPRMVYNLDPGILSRIVMLTTYRTRELDSMKGSDLGPASIGSPSIYPVQHFAWLCEKYSIDLDTLMLWALRLCADRFWDLIQHNSFELFTETERLKKYLRTTFDDNVNVALVNALMLCHCVRHGARSEEYFIPEINTHYLKESLEAFQFLAIDTRALYFRAFLKQDWENKGRPCTHAWEAFNKILLSSIDVAIEGLNEAIASEGKKLDAVVKSTFQGFMLRSGFKLSSDIVWVTSIWGASRVSHTQIHYLSKELVEKMSGNTKGMENLETVLNPSEKADTAYLFSTNWSPEILEAQADKAIQGGI